MDNMQKWPPEPWRIEDIWVMSADKERIHPILTCGLDHYVDQECVPRIVACVNACAGVPTEVLNDAHVPNALCHHCANLLFCDGYEKINSLRSELQNYFQNRVSKLGKGELAWSVIIARCRGFKAKEAGDGHSDKNDGA